MKNQYKIHVSQLVELLYKLVDENSVVKLEGDTLTVLGLKTSSKVMGDDDLTKEPTDNKAEKKNETEIKRRVKKHEISND